MSSFACLLLAGAAASLASAVSHSELPTGLMRRDSQRSVSLSARGEGSSRVSGSGSTWPEFKLKSMADPLAELCLELDATTSTFSMKSCARSGSAEEAAQKFEAEGLTSGPTDTPATATSISNTQDVNGESETKVFCVVNGVLEAKNEANCIEADDKEFNFLKSQHRCFSLSLGVDDRCLIHDGTLSGAGTTCPDQTIEETLWTTELDAIGCDAAPTPAPTPAKQEDGLHGSETGQEAEVAVGGESKIHFGGEVIPNPVPTPAPVPADQAVNATVAAAAAAAAAGLPAPPPPPQYGFMMRNVESNLCLSMGKVTPNTFNQVTCNGEDPAQKFHAHGSLSPSSGETKVNFDKVTMHGGQVMCFDGSAAALAYDDTCSSHLAKIELSPSSRDGLSAGDGSGACFKVKWNEPCVPKDVSPNIRCVADIHDATPPSPVCLIPPHTTQDIEAREQWCDGTLAVSAVFTSDITSANKDLCPQMVQSWGL